MQTASVLIESYAPPKAKPMPALLSPALDQILIGGASLIVFAFYWLFVDTGASDFHISWIAYYLAVLVNGPHFMSSYQLLYGDYRSLLLSKGRFFWAGVIVPILLIGAIAAALVFENVRILSFMLQGMYLSVGWHYVKQTYGTALVASIAEKRYFTNLEKYVARANLISVWAMSWVSINLVSQKFESDGISYYTVGLPDWTMTAAYTVTVVTLIATAFLFIRKYIRTGVRPAFSSILAFATIYSWYIPALYHPLFFYFIPFFHSLQYMLFVFALKRNQAEKRAALAPDAEASRTTELKTLWGFYGLAVILGLCSFTWVPESLDKVTHFNAGVFGPTVWMFAFNIFINIHHYFIDNVIWRGDNPLLKDLIRK